MEHCPVSGFGRHVPEAKFIAHSTSAEQEK
jgi:hypothetical protein